jgi:D-alanyl-D-alanine carboxypeptidase, serine-type, PBP4 family
MCGVKIISTFRSTLLFAALVAVSCSVTAALPEAWQDALRQAAIPEDALSVVIQEVHAEKPLLQHREKELMNPASVMKLVTTAAAFDLLGMNYRWKTEVYLGGEFAKDDPDTFNGNVILKGYGDPKITIEQWQAFMQGLYAAGLHKINGDLYFDRSFFSLPQHNPSAFDKEPLKPYNVGPDAMLVSFKSVRFEVSAPADKNAKSAEVIVEPPLPAITIESRPTLTSKKCGDWWHNARPVIRNNDTHALATFRGTFSRRCGAREYYVSLLDVPTFLHGMFTHYFQEAGGTFSGKIKEVTVAESAVPWITFYSLPFNEIITDINKKSNNVMAQQLFLTLPSKQSAPPHTRNKARIAVAEWLQEKKIAMPGLFIDNGSGLSRDSRLTAAGLNALLLYIDQSPWRDTFLETLPIAGIDGTLKNRFKNSPSYQRVQMKSGLLENVRSLSGFIEDDQGKRYAATIIINHENARRCKEVIDTITNWVADGSAAAYEATSSKSTALSGANF